MVLWLQQFEYIRQAIILLRRVENATLSIIRPKNRAEIAAHLANAEKAVQEGHIIKAAKSIINAVKAIGHTEMVLCEWYDMTCGCSLTLEQYFAVLYDGDHQCKLCYKPETERAVSTQVDVLEQIRELLDSEIACDVPPRPPAMTASQKPERNQLELWWFSDKALHKKLG